MGTAVFNNELLTTDSGEWLVRGWVEQSGIALFSGEETGLVVKVEPGGEASLSDILDLASANNDIVLDIFAVYGLDPVFQMPPFIRGVGVRQRSTYGSAPTSATYAMLGAALVDGRSRKVIASVISEGHQRLPFVALDSGPARKTNTEAGVRASIRTQIDMTVLELLSRLGLLK